ncbi:MAG: DUF5667 domain-containing protein [bacterium]|nr:DUF5667 domain-containing protein [bacterium]
MNNLEKQLDKLGTEVSLSRTEKDAMREHLHEYMAHFPIRRGVVHTPIAIYTWVSYRATAFALVAALVFTSGVGVTYAAAGALPGEPLYAVKEFSEEVKAVLAVGDEARAEWAVARTHRRLEEASVLAAKDKLDDDTRTIVEEKFEKNLSRAQAKIEKLRERDDTAAETLETILAVGVEASAEILEKRSSRADYNAKRGDERNEQRSRVASFARSHVAVSSRTHDGDVVATLSQETEEHDTAEVVMLSAEISAPVAVSDVPGVSPAAVEALAEAVSREHASLLLLVKTLPEYKQQALQNALADIAKVHENALADMQEGRYENAHGGLLWAFKDVRKIETALRLHLDASGFLNVVPSVSSNEEEAGENNDSGSSGEDDDRFFNTL